MSKIVDKLFKKKPEYFEKLANIKENLFIEIYNTYNR